MSAYEVRADQVSLFFGRKGTGKSDLARYFFSLFNVRPRICVDVKDEHADALPGVPTVYSPTDVFEHQTVRIVPRDPRSEDWYDELFGRAFEHRDILIWAEELNVFTGPNTIPDEVARYVLQGRVRKCGFLGTTPRPVNTHGDIRSMADHIFVFKLKYHNDRATIARDIDVADVGEITHLLRKLPKYGFLHYSAEADESDESAIVTNDPVHDPDALTAELGRLYFGPYDPS